MRLMKTTLITLLMLSSTAHAQEILNGDFEDHGDDDLGCALNLDDASFAQALPGCFSFGEPEGEICVMVGEDGCGWGLPPARGDTKIGIASQPNGTFDRLALQLSEPLVAGNEYILRLRVNAVITEFSPDHGIVEIGVSDDPHSFGERIQGFGASSGWWSDFRLDFHAPIDGQYITARIRDGGVVDAWVHLDAFELRPCSATCAADLDGDGQVGALDLLAVLANWDEGPGGGIDGDATCDGSTDVDDLIEVLVAWGACD